MDSPSMAAAAAALANQDLRVARFEFEYMASRRIASTRKPPPRAEKLIPEYLAAVDALRADGKLVIGGKSMGGRVASMIADDLYSSGTIKGLLCLGYPFHPPGKSEQLRTNHLAELATPTLIVQGTRDVFGGRDEVEGYSLSSQISLLWLEDGDHDLKPRKGSGFSQLDHFVAMATAVSRWAMDL